MSKNLWNLDAGRCLGWLCLCALLLACAALRTVAGEGAEKQPKRPPSLEEALEQQAKVIRAFVRDKMNPKHKDSLHVCAVKFLVKLGNEQPSDNAGPLNWQLARRLETALILHLPEAEEKSFRILHIHNPGEELMGKADHRTLDGRKAFFKKRYAPFWGGDKKLPADVFLTGLVEVADEARTMQVTVQAFNETDNKLVKVCSFPVVAEPRLLTEAGISFVLARGGIPREEFKDLAAGPPNRTELDPDAKVVLPNQQSKAGKQKARVTVSELLEKSPIDFQILYKHKGENRPRVMKIREDGTVPQPTEDTEVSFQLKRKKNAGNFPYGVVVKVNGENTIYPEEIEPDDSRAHKWVLDPKDEDEGKTYPPITGFLKKSVENKAAKFIVLPASESKLEEVNYGLHAGTFTIIIFEGRMGGKKPVEREESETVLAIARGVPDSVGTPDSLRALQGKLREQVKRKPKVTNAVPRGLIVGGELTNQAVVDVPFRSNPTPVSAINIRYYKPRHGE